MLILTEFCTLNIFRAKNSKQSLGEERPQQQGAGEGVCAPEGNVTGFLRAFPGGDRSSPAPMKDLRGDPKAGRGTWLIAELPIDGPIKMGFLTNTCTKSTSRRHVGCHRQEKGIFSLSAVTSVWCHERTGKH